MPDSPWLSSGGAPRIGNWGHGMNWWNPGLRGSEATEVGGSGDGLGEKVISWPTGEDKGRM